MALAARRVGTNDFIEIGVVSTPKRYVPRPLDDDEKGDVEHQAIVILKAAGWRNEEIARVLKRTERFVRKRLQIARNVYLARVGESD